MSCYWPQLKKALYLGAWLWLVGQVLIPVVAETWASAAGYPKGML